MSPKLLNPRHFTYLVTAAKSLGNSRTPYQMPHWPHLSGTLFLQSVCADLSLVNVKSANAWRAPNDQIDIENVPFFDIKEWDNHKFDVIQVIKGCYHLLSQYSHAPYGDRKRLECVGFLESLQRVAIEAFPYYKNNLEFKLPSLHSRERKLI